MTTLLRPRTGQTAAEWRWTSTEVPPPGRWCERAGEDRPAGWTVRARHWPGPEDPAREIPVVVVHGLVVASGMSAPVAARLAQDGPVHAPDLPGCGRSDKPQPPLDVTELGETLTTWVGRSVRRAPVLVGTSLGAQVALSAAARSPHAYRGLVLVSPTVDRERRSWWSQLPRWQRETATQSMRLRLLQARDYARAGIPRAVRTFSAALRHRPEDEVRRLDLPTLVVVGRRDPLLRTDWARELAHHAPQGRLAVVPDAVHAMSHENPLELSRVVNGFIDGLTTEGGR
jgi:pimeloyl-ACP methyl ester carboxylesterase